MPDFTLPPIAAGLRQAGATNRVKVISVQLADPAVIALIKKGQVQAVGNAALGASSWIAVDAAVNALATHKPICRNCWHKYEYMFGYTMVDKRNLNATWALRPGFLVQTPVVDYVSYFKKKWKAAFVK